MNAPRLIHAFPWGRVALVEGSEAGSATVITTIEALPGADLEGATGLAQRWQNARAAAIVPVAAVSATAGALEVRRPAPLGSTLAEVLDGYGRLGEVQAAALFLDLIAAVRDCHQRRLVVGALHVDNLFVCPPGMDATPALRLYEGGASLMVAAARGELPRADSTLLGHAVAPEVRAGRLPSATSDAWCLAAAVAHTVLGRPAFEGGTADLLLHATQQGPGAELRHVLHRRAPHLAGPLIQGLSATPLLRAGAIDDLATAAAGLLPNPSRLSVASGEGPWALGTPLMPLAAYAGTTPWGQRFAERLPLAVHAEAPLDEAPADRARLDAALRELEVHRALSQQGQQRRERTGLKALVVLLTALIAAAIAWFGTRPRPVVRTSVERERARLRLRRAPPPKAVRSIPLFREEDRKRRRR